MSVDTSADALAPAGSSKEKEFWQIRPLFVTGVSLLVGAGTIGGAVAVAVTAWGGAGTVRLEGLLAALIILMLGVVLFRGLWTLRSWARSAAIWLLVLGLVYFLSGLVFEVSAQVFGGQQALSLGEIGRFVLGGLLKAAAGSCIPAGILFGLVKLGPRFEETLAQRHFADRAIRYVLVASALSAIFIVFLIVVFTLQSAWPAIAQNGVGQMLVGTIWRPNQQQFGVLPMIVGSVLSTLGAVILGVPLSLATAILLAEIAPRSVREVIHPAVELLAGIPSVVYGLFGMVVLAPLIRDIQLPYNSGFGLLNASVILAVMILPTVATVSEDAIRAVPRYYKEGALALGATHWQAIWSVMLPAARSGIVAAIILGIGRALGETMALIMVIGNAIAMPSPLNGNPLTLFLSAARTLTGNIAVEINYASGVHKSSLFFTGVLLLAMILAIDMLAHYLMRERISS
jgi:phosphate transport system permease protein